MSFSELENDTLNQSELNEIKIKENNHIDSRFLPNITNMLSIKKLEHVDDISFRVILLLRLQSSAVRKSQEDQII
jgi:hypothetical protein